jgi:hypothetical protein
MRPDYNLPPGYTSTSYEQAAALSPEDGLPGFGGIRPYGVMATEQGPIITGLDEYGQVVERALVDMPGIVGTIGEHVIFGYAHKTAESQQRVVTPLGVWHGEHEGHPRQVRTWYLVAEDIGRRDPKTRIVTAVHAASIKYFSLACFLRGPIGDAGDSEFRASQGLPVIA